MKWRARVRRWSIGLGVVVLALFGAGTTYSFGYDELTNGTVPVPAGLSYVRTGDLTTRYISWGTRGTPIVLIHGAVESADVWDGLGPLLARDHRVYAIDLDGSGYTERVAPYDLDHQARQVLAFLDAMRLARPLLVGHSAGAAVAADATLLAPGRIGGLMFLDGDGLLPDHSTLLALSVLGEVAVDPYRTAVLRLLVRSDSFIRTVYAQQCGPGCPPLSAAGVEQWRRPFQVPGAEAALWQQLSGPPLGLTPAQESRLRTLRLPVAVVFGAQDDAFGIESPVQVARLVGAPPPTTIAGARHLPMISSPKALAAAVQVLARRAANGGS